MKIVTVLGARPQFIKASVVSRALAQYAHIQEVIVHTGQHFDQNMSDIFFNEMQIPTPKYNLDIHGLGHGAMTGRMMEGIENILQSEAPDWVMVYGDTNSTLAGALTASKMHLKVAHVEAGLRSFNMKMPEEINRILTDRISTLLFCPTDTAIQNLKKEGFDNFKCEVLNIGDVMQDAAIHFAQFAKPPAGISIPEKFILATIHRAENTDDLEKLKVIVDSLNALHQNLPVIFPMHPRTKAILEKHQIPVHFQVIEPVGYLEMVFLLKNCSLVMTDSGGVQKEAYFFEKPCVTLRDETEWVELVNLGVNSLTRIDKTAILSAVENMQHRTLDFTPAFYGGGKASEKIVARLLGG